MWGKAAIPVLWNVCISESNNQILFFVNKIMHNFKIGFKCVKDFLIQTYILAVFKGETSKVILFSYVQRHRFDKKLVIII